MVKIKPTKPVRYIKGLGAAFKSINAAQSDPHSWIAKTEDTFVFTAEIDHKHKARNQYDHMKGTFKSRYCRVL